MSLANCLGFVNANMIYQSVLVATNAASGYGDAAWPLQHHQFDSSHRPLPRVIPFALPCFLPAAAFQKDITTYR